MPKNKSGGNKTSGNKTSGNDGVQSVLSQIGVGTPNVRIHFDGTFHEGTFLGFQNGSVILRLASGTVVFIKRTSITAVDFF
ncbi:hypothetical protein PALU110988_19200 [Paenibacillus lupini]|uniref:hypothetical protein n=1 Tax=Paenibacillus lupini TaxID=1450204 RepID=UPI00141F5F62|nr:hypothetical protein [Paenibacillus lupini]NIK24320.1 hypothetical protein [Paenibacillus lupini]